MNTPTFNPAELIRLDNRRPMKAAGEILQVNDGQTQAKFSPAAMRLLGFTSEGGSITLAYHPTTELYYVWVPDPAVGGGKRVQANGTLTAAAILSELKPGIWRLNPIFVESEGVKYFNIVFEEETPDTNVDETENLAAGAVVERTSSPSSHPVLAAMEETAEEILSPLQQDEFARY